MTLLVMEVMTVMRCQCTWRTVQLPLSPLTTHRPLPPPWRTPATRSCQKIRTKPTWQEAQMVMLASSLDGQAAADIAHGESGAGQGKEKA